MRKILIVSYVAFFLVITLIFSTNTFAGDELTQTVQNYFTKSGRLITAPQLQDIMNDGDVSNDPLLLDVRGKSSFEAGTIPGAIWIESYTKILEPDNLKKLDSALDDHFNKTGNRKLVMWCGSGHGGMQLATAMGILGYETTALKYGWGGWTSNDADFRKGAREVYGPAEYLTRKGRLEYSPKLKAKFENNDLADLPLFLDARRFDSYKEGTIPGAVWIDFYINMLQPENLAKLDAALEEHYAKTGNKRIVTWCTSGHGGTQLATALGSIGYEAAALMYGWSGWVGDDSRFLENSNAAGGPVVKPEIKSDAVAPAEQESCS